MFGWLRGKQLPPIETIPIKPRKANGPKLATIKPNARTDAEDKQKHQDFCSELEAIMTESGLFKKEYINHIAKFYRDNYLPYVGESALPVQQWVAFADSLKDASNLDDSLKWFYVMVLIAQSRACELRDLRRRQGLGVEKVTFTFMNNLDSHSCTEYAKLRKKYDGKTVRIVDAPITPLRSCYRCNQGHIGAQTRAVIL